MTQFQRYLGNWGKCHTKITITIPVPKIPQSWNLGRDRKAAAPTEIVLHDRILPFLRFLCNLHIPRMAEKMQCESDDANEVTRKRFSFGKLLV